MSLIIRQASKILEVTYIVPMEVAEARAEMDGVRRDVTSACERLARVYERQGWKALGYPSMVACMRAELDLSKTRGYELLAYVKIKKNLEGVSAIAEKIPEINEAQAREIKHLPPQAQREVWEASVKATNGKPTAKAVAAQVREQACPAPKPASPSGRRAQREDNYRRRINALLDRASSKLEQETYEWLAERLGVSS